MRRIVLTVAMTVLALTLSTCTDRSSSPSVSQPTASIRQMGGCLGNPVTRVSQLDSCFAFQFYDTLIVSFCLTGNCCPDSDRFRFSCTVFNDTVYIAASDTAAILCKCICSYSIRAEFANLPLGHYIIIVTRSDYSDRVVFYNEYVFRHMPPD